MRVLPRSCFVKPTVPQDDERLWQPTEPLCSVITGFVQAGGAEQSNPSVHSSSDCRGSAWDGAGDDKILISRAGISPEPLLCSLGAAAVALHWPNLSFQCATRSQRDTWEHPTAGMISVPFCSQFSHT